MERSGFLNRGPPKKPALRRSLFPAVPTTPAPTPLGALVTAAQEEETEPSTPPYYDLQSGDELTETDPNGNSTTTIVPSTSTIDSAVAQAPPRHAEDDPGFTTLYSAPSAPVRADHYRSFTLALPSTATWSLTNARRFELGTVSYHPFDPTTLFVNYRVWDKQTAKRTGGAPEAEPVVKKTKKA